MCMCVGSQEVDGGEVQDRHKQMVFQQATLLSCKQMRHLTLKLQKLILLRHMAYALQLLLYQVLC